MTEKNEYPPNYEEIKRVMNPPKNALFPYGDILYNPGGKKIPEDIIFHEEIHGKQQREYTDPSFWWQKWLYNNDFRLEQERQAYGKQYKFIKDNYPVKAHKEALDELATNFSTLYKLNINKHQAETLIRKYNNN